MHLPTELIQEILSHIPSDDEETLRSCSLVAKSWLDPCRRYLFESVFIETNTYQSWLDNISPTNTKLLRHVRRLEYVAGGNKPWFPPCGDDLRYYLPSFYRLQHLKFCLVDIEPTIPDHTNLSFAFQHTLLSLSFIQISITWDGFVTLLGHFPNLNTLEISRVKLETGTRSTPHLPRALRGRLFIRCTGLWDPEPFIDRLTGLKLEYEELVIIGDHHQRLIAAVEGSLKRLLILRFYAVPTLDLSRCPELCQLKVTMTQPKWGEQTFISSITSNNLKKITFASCSSRLEWDLLSRDRCWVLLDDILCGLVDRLRMSGYKHTLEVEFRERFVDLDWEGDRDRFLPKFKEKGRVRVVETSSGKFREWP